MRPFPRGSEPDAGAYILANYEPKHHVKVLSAVSDCLLDIDCY